MANDMNRWIGIVRLTRDPELKYTQSGTPVCSFSGASNYSYGKGDQRKEAVSFFNFIAWGKYPGEVIAGYVKKGQRLAIDGRLQQRSWEKDGQKRNVVEIVVESFNFIDSKKDGQSASNETGLGVEVDPADVPAHADFDDESIPF